MFIDTGGESRVGDLRLDPYPPIIGYIGYIGGTGLPKNDPSDPSGPDFKKAVATDVYRNSNRCVPIQARNLLDRCVREPENNITM